MTTGKALSSPDESYSYRLKLTAIITSSMPAGVTILATASPATLRPTKLCQWHDLVKKCVYYAAKAHLTPFVPP